jgi:CheY-like chemotaxis protein
VRQSGGQIRIYSELGKGTTMCLYLPRFVGSAELQEDAQEAEEIEAGDGETVLVIEDEQSIRQLIAEVLEEAGYRTLTARDGAAGLKVLQSSTRIDLLITDVGLPGGMNGRQVADAALEHGMEILTKPFEITALARRVRAMTGS